MINKIFVLPREVINEWIVSKHKPNTLFGDWALISIYGLVDGPLVTNDTLPILSSIGCVKTISLRFADIKPDEFNSYLKKHKDALTTDVLGDSQATQILKFLDSLKDESFLIVHCAAGISRSGAVGLFSCRYLGLDQAEFRKMNRGISPNSHVLDVLNKCSNTDDLYLKFWQDALAKNDRIRGRTK